MNAKPLLSTLIIFASFHLSMMGSSQDNQRTMMLPVVKPDGEKVDVQSLALYKYNGDAPSGNIKIVANESGAGIIQESGFSEYPDLLSLVDDQTIHNELGLIEDQVNQLKKAQTERTNEIKNLMNEMFLAMNDQHAADPHSPKHFLSPENCTTLEASISRLRHDSTARLKNILLPHQPDRLRQISCRNYFANAGLAKALTNEEFADQLDISDEQLARLKKRGREIVQQLVADIQGLQQNAHQELLEELTVDQRRKWDEMVGEPFTRTPPREELDRKSKQ